MMNYQEQSGVLAGSSRHSGSANETAPQRHRILGFRVRHRRRQPNAPFPSSHGIRRRQVTVVEEVDTSSTPGRFLNKDNFERYIAYIGIAVTVVTQMNGSSENQKIRSVFFLGVILANYAMELWAMSHIYDIHQAKWKVIIFGIAFNFTKLLSFYVLLSVLKPEWFTWCGFVIVCIIATVYKCSDKLKTKVTWCGEKGVQVINYVIDKVLKPCKDQASLASAPPRASV